MMGLVLSLSVALVVLLTRHFHVSSNSSLAPMTLYSEPYVCSADVLEEVLMNLPHCSPRNVSVELTMEMADRQQLVVEEVMPPWVQVPRCSGVCHEGSQFHTCVPSPTGRSWQSFKVS